MASSARALHKFFVGNLPWTVSHRELRNYFREFGRVTSANVVFDKETGHSKGYGFITFANKSATEKLEQVSKHCMDGQVITVQKPT